MRSELFKLLSNSLRRASPPSAGAPVVRLHEEDKDICMKKIKIFGLKFIELKVIADLGFARELDDFDLAATRLGTPLIMAPETLAGE